MRFVQRFVEGTSKDVFGATIIRSKLGPASVRKNLQTRLLPCVEVGLIGWQRAHSQGSGTGVESSEAIRYAPQEVNQAYQNLGIERYLRELIMLKPPDTELWLTTVTEAHPGTFRLKEIQYRVDAVRGSEHRRLFEAEIQVANQRLSPVVTVNATPYLRTF